MSMQTRLINEVYEQTNDFFIDIPDHNIRKTLPEFLTLGREISNSIPLSDPFVSSRHCRIEKKDNSFILKDLRSRNGTFVNGTQILEASLKHGDIIKIGQTELLIKSEAIAYPKSKMTSKNEALQNQLKNLASIAQSDFPVLMIGPTGSGKEVLAKEIHQLSDRNLESLVTLNCSAFTPNLVESQLFGHLEGSFTGATKNRKGAFAEAHEGTLFLDEIGDLPLDVQPKLLRALEYGEIIPVGSDKAVKIDVRIIAATHKNLDQMVNEGLFREDLLYRLKTFTLNPPSLIERIEDFESILFQIAKEFRVRFSFGTIQKMKEFRWPGNIRQLRQSVQRASVLYPAQTVLPEHLEFIIDEQKSKAEVSLEKLVQLKENFSNKSVLKQVEKELILDRLAANQGNQRQTARDLGIAKSTLNDKIKTYKTEINSI